MELIAGFFVICCNKYMIFCTFIYSFGKNKDGQPENESYKCQKRQEEKSEKN